MRLRRREGPGSSGSQLQWEANRLAQSSPSPGLGLPLTPRLHPPCSLASEGEMAKPQWGMSPGLLILLVTILYGPCLGSAQGIRWQGALLCPLLRTCPALPCPALLHCEPPR